MATSLKTGFWQWIKDALVDARLWLGDRLRRLSAGTWRKIVLAVVIVIALYYPVGMIAVHKVDDDPDFAPAGPMLASNLAEGASLSVAMVAALIDREVDGHGWVANDPFFYPSAALDNMPNYQLGMVSALSRFTFELRDQIGRTRGSSASDPDLEQAAGNLAKEGDRWVFNLSTSVLPTTPSESYFREARQQLLDYNDRLARGDAVFERRSDNLLATLDRIALDVGASSAALETHIDARSGAWLDFQADDLFYRIKGGAYGYYMILKALRTDFANVIEDRDLVRVYDLMLASFAQVVALDPWVIANSEPDGQLFPNHLAAQGFYLLRARTQLRELTNILLK